MEDSELSETLDRLLALALERGAIKYGDFTLTSGKKSSYYFDGRLLSLDPEGDIIGKLNTVVVSGFITQGSLGTP